MLRAEISITLTSTGLALFCVDICDRGVQCEGCSDATVPPKVMRAGYLVSCGAQVVLFVGMEKRNGGGWASIGLLVWLL